MRTFISRLERCRIIVRAGVGFDHIDLAAAERAGIPVCNTPDYGTSEVADHAIAMMLALRRGIVSYQNELEKDPQAGFDYLARRSCGACAAAPSASSGSGGSARLRPCGQGLRHARRRL